MTVDNFLSISQPLNLRDHEIGPQYEIHIFKQMVKMNYGI